MPSEKAIMPSLHGNADIQTRIVADGLSFPESPRWRDGALWFSDIHAHRLYRLTPGSAPEVKAELPDRASGLGFLPDGRPLVVSMLDRRLLCVQSDGSLSLHADLSHLSRRFINDMVVDAHGRAYVGSRNGGDAASKSDGLIFVDQDGTCRIAVPDMVSPNGAVITPDGRSLVVAETAIGGLTRFAIDKAGNLGNRESVALLPGRHLDGICRDAAGGFWAGGGAGGLLRIAANGTLLQAIEFPGRMVLACSLGGPDGRTLFLATTDMSLLDNLAYIGFDRDRDSQVSSDGRIEAITVEIPRDGPF